MDGLDLLKKDWNKSESNYPKLSYDEIYKMVLKKSSSIVKWIYYISLIELSLGLILIILNPTFENKIEYPKWLDIFSYLVFPVALYFIYLFYTNYKKISATDSAKVLMQNILRTRKCVRYYIIFNLFFGGVFFAVASFIGYTQLQGGIDAFNEATGLTEYIVVILVILLITVLFLGIIFAIYYLLYGILLRRLKHNYKELKKLED
ncbi:hypothetical protein [Hyunsoonleella pacifica]|uniref:Uncharacterized protein n=1 Tax=Hyunsoonleella pacifica TaxID=1080224 RepID=A0A4V2JAV5_9FLAO|nr:hypothetical protein [Hyunsoonleella pacifica]TBN15375.1 hypothetical protein EYD46_09540 [Hyunsoonleella pacifica]GGD23534.1 hypothetical protein GCM10011368_27000 [Hyunsoonleella pacifica]